MSLSDIYAKRKPARNCGTCQWYDKLDDKDRKFFDERVVDIQTERGVRVRLYRTCVDAGLDISENTFAYHLRNHHGSR